MIDSVFSGYRRADGGVGIRNHVLVIYLVECAHHVARQIVSASDNPAVQLAGFPGCYPNEYALRMMKKLATHPNVGGALLVSLGCEGFNRSALAAAISESGRPVETLASGYQLSGSHQVVFRPSRRLPASGMYVAYLRMGNQAVSKQFTIIR